MTVQLIHGIVDFAHLVTLTKGLLMKYIIFNADVLLNNQITYTGQATFYYLEVSKPLQLTNSSHLEI